jgi:crotonobetainyl-CoA:carnitine CoA-transferase CaiB-like acyl-CoA transferase
MTANAPVLLPPLRVLDLTDQRGHLAGKILGDLGADVVKIEPPGGDTARQTGPFYLDETRPDYSLSWWAANTSKRGITLDIECERGGELLRQLLARADILLESYDPGHLADLGFSFDALARMNSQLIVVSMTPFGQSGPYAGYADSDLVLMSMGGMTYLSGDEDRPPVSFSAPQAYYQLGAMGAAASLLAYFARKRTGRGQHVDVSGQASVVWTTMGESAYSLREFHDDIQRRRGGTTSPGPIRPRWLYACRDGWVVTSVAQGSAVLFSTENLIEWMASEGAAPQWLTEIDWRARSASASQSDSRESLQARLELVRRVEDAVSDFLKRFTKSELLREATDRHILMSPVMDVADISESEHLADRGYFKDVYHPALGQSIRYPAVTAHFTGGVVSIQRPPPGIGEHNVEVYCGELGITSGDFHILRDQGVI